MADSSKRGKYSSKTLHHKYEALIKLEKGGAKKDVASHYNIPRNTLSMWIKNKDKVIKAFKGGDKQSQQRLTVSNHDTLDGALYKWFVKVREEGIPISGTILERKSIEIF